MARRWLKWLGIMLALGAVTFVVLNLGLRVAAPNMRQIGDPLVLFGVCLALPVGIFLMFTATVALHELGHVLAARWRGMTLEWALVLGVPLYTRTGNDQEVARSAWAAVVATKENVTKADLAWFYLGGPIVSLVGATLLLVPHPAREPLSISIGMVNLFGLLNLICFLGSIIPLGYVFKVPPNDGNHLFYLLAKPKLAIELAHGIRLSLYLKELSVPELRPFLDYMGDAEFAEEMRFCIEFWTELYDGANEPALFQWLNESSVPQNPEYEYARATICNVYYCLSLLYGEDDQQKAELRSFAEQNNALPGLHLVIAFEAKLVGKTDVMNMHLADLRKQYAEFEYPFIEAYERFVDRHFGKAQ